MKESKRIWSRAMLIAADPPTGVNSFSFGSEGFRFLIALRPDWFN